MQKILLSRRGDGYIELCLSIFVLVTVLAVGLYVMGYVVQRQTADTICSNLLEVATTTGEFGEDFDDANESLQAMYFSYDLTIDGDWFNEAYKTVQLGHRMTVQVSFTSYLVSWGGLKIPVTVTVKKQGLSQNYWK